MIGIGALFTNNGGILDLIDIEESFDLILLDNGTDYAPSYTFDVYEELNDGLVSSCSQGKDNVMYAYEFS